MRKHVLLLLPVVALLLLGTGVSAADIQSQWESSMHNIANVDTSSETAPSKRDNCIACHDGEGFAANVTKRADIPGSAKDTVNSIDCATCHGTRGTEITKSGSTGTLANGLAIEGAGSGALCISCHNGRKLPDAAKKPAPHRSPQFDVLYAAAGATVAGESYPSSPHGANPDSCVSCHVANLDGVANHTFEVVEEPSYVEEACGSCHPGLTTVNRTALADYDGDKVIEGIQDEVEGLIEVLTEAVAEKEEALGAHFGESHGAFHWVDQAENEVQVPEAIYYARFNLALVEEDGSLGVHNPAYVVTLLQKSYEEVTGEPVPDAVLR